MKHGHITIHFQHYWHCGSGQAGEGDVDLLPVTEPCGLPYVPGRSLRGRLRWAAVELGWTDALLEQVFGKADAPVESIGALQVANATMRDAFAAKCRRHFASAKPNEGKVLPEVSALFEDIASTSLEGGVARSKTLRRVRYVVPVTVIAEVTLEDDSLWDRLNGLVGKLRVIGKGKHDGFGSCRASLKLAASPEKPRSPGPAAAYALDLELLDDVVLSANSATVGGHRTLDHVPGSSLMGAFARGFFAALKARHPSQTEVEREGAKVLLEAKVSFGNGVPIGPSGAATVPLPLSWHYAKGEPGIGVDGAVHRDRVSSFASVDYQNSSLGQQNRQPVQIREGWLDAGRGQVVNVPRTQTLKTAVDPDPSKYETAKEKALFGYEAIAKGERFTARIEVNRADPVLRKSVCDAFDGRIIRLGRSKGTEFGRARCELKVTGRNDQASAKGKLILLVESDLALLDNMGFPTLEPAPSHFGLAGDWELCRKHSYLRFRRYSLWNAKRGGPDVERQVISKGSVLVFTNDDTNMVASPTLRVGLGQSEGLGRVRVAEDWMKDEHPKFAGAHGGQTAQPTARAEETHDATDLTPWVEDRYNEKTFDIRAALTAAKWSDEWRRTARKQKASISASQWGRLDEAARDSADKTRLLGKLGDPDVEHPDTVFGHGRKRREWISGGQGSLAHAVLLSLRTEQDERLALAAFRDACRRMAAQTRRERD